MEKVALGVAEDGLSALTWLAGARRLVDTCAFSNVQYVERNIVSTAWFRKGLRISMRLMLELGLCSDMSETAMKF